MTARISLKLINITYITIQTLLIGVYAVKENYSNLFGSLLVLILYILFLLYENKSRPAITGFIRISVLVTILLNSFIGEYLHLYYTSTLFDKILHTFGTFSFSAFIFSIIDKRNFFKNTTIPLIFMFVLLLGISIGTVFEIGEFILDVIFKTKNQSSLIDTNLDMIYNIPGAALAGIYAIRQKYTEKD